MVNRDSNHQIISLLLVGGHKLTFMENLPSHHLNTLNIVPSGEGAEVGDGTIFCLLQAEAKP